MLRRFRIAAAFTLAAMAAVHSVQAQDLYSRFVGPAPEAGWSLRGTASLTAPAVEPAGTGWLRLTGNAHNAAGMALQSAGGISAATGLSISFDYVSWGGGQPGADGIVVFLYDATADLAGALGGGALGYCKAAGGWLAIGLDEYGNFSNPDVGCGGGPGLKPQSLVLRGPTSAGNPFLGGVPVPGGVDRPTAQTRPAASQVVVNLQPKMTGVGYGVTVDWRPQPGQARVRLLDRANFPFAAPAALRVGIAAATGGAKNFHEVREMRVSVHQPPTVHHVFEPSEIAAGRKSTVLLQLGSTDKSPAVLVEHLTYQLPAGVRVATPVVLGGTCPGVVRAAAGGDSVTLERGSAVRAAGCTMTVEVVATRAGSFSSTVPAGALITDRGPNLQPSSATLIAR
jgi:hypothetical protein